MSVLLIRSFRFPRIYSYYVVQLTFTTYGNEIKLSVMSPILRYYIGNTSR